VATRILCSIYRQHTHARCSTVAPIYRGTGHHTPAVCTHEHAQARGDAVILTENDSDGSKIIM
jgi:hypothetical protein